MSGPRWTDEAELRARILEIASAESATWPPSWRGLLTPPPLRLVPARGTRGRPRDPARARVLAMVIAADPKPPARVLALAALVAGAALNDGWRCLPVGAVIRAEARAAGHAVRALRQQIKPHLLSLSEVESIAQAQ